MSGVAPYAKAIVAFFVAGLGSLAGAFAEGSDAGRGLSAFEIVTALSIALAAVVAVYAVPNGPDQTNAAGQPDVNDPVV
jgi:hypothetical protein